MLMEVTHVNTSPEKDKFVVLLIDEMYVREGILYEKHTGRMIGFSNLGDINSHLSQFEQGVHNSSISISNAVLAKTMVVFMACLTSCSSPMLSSQGMNCMTCFGRQLVE